MNTRSSLLLLALSLPLVAAACGDDGASPTDTSSGSGGSGGDGTTATSAGPVAVSSAASTSGSGSTGSGTQSASTGGEGGAGDGGAAGTGGDGGAGQGGAGGAAPFVCEMATFGGASSTIADVWAADPAEATAYWTPGVVITAISLGGCQADAFCQIFVQQEASFASFDDGAQQAIRVIVAPEVAAEFVALQVGDRVDLGGWAWRDTTGDRDELRFFIRESDPGCMNVVGAAAPEPVLVELGDLTQNAYEATHGPLLVRLDTVSGRPHMPNELFALWDSGSPQGGGIETVTNASPFFAPTGAFTGFVAEEILDFATVTGVFGQFIPGGSSTKYETIYIRSQADIVVLP